MCHISASSLLSSREDIMFLWAGGSPCLFKALPCWIFFTHCNEGNNLIITFVSQGATHIPRVSSNVVPSHVLSSSHAGNHLIRGAETTDQCGQSSVPADSRGFSGESDIKLIRFHQGSRLGFFGRHVWTRDSDVNLFWNCPAYQK